MKEHIAKTGAAEGQGAAGYASTHPDSSSHQHQQQHTFSRTLESRELRQRIQDNPIHFNSIDFDSISLTDPLPAPQNAYDDWLWDKLMEDFTMPPL